MSASVYSQDGSLDPTFDNDGIVTTSIGSGNDHGNTIRIQSDGKIVVAGNSGNNLAIARYNTNAVSYTHLDVYKRQELYTNCY